MTPRQQRELDNAVLGRIARSGRRAVAPGDLHGRFGRHRRTAVEGALRRLAARGRVTQGPDGVTWRPPDRDPRPTGGSWS